jgi:hypothetical protein
MPLAHTEIFKNRENIKTLAFIIRVKAEDGSLKTEGEK